ncbi:conserved alanine and proline rich protein [Mycobacterium tuberculosis T46]|nr:conserved alanine and proline rich protein [Mycobacterium tuberculosis T46]
MPTIWTFVRAAAVLVGFFRRTTYGRYRSRRSAPAPAPAPNIPQQADQLGRQRTRKFLQNLRQRSGRPLPPLSAPQSCGTRPRRPRDNRHLSKTGAGGPAASRGPRANSVHFPGVNAPIPGNNPGGTGASPSTAPGGQLRPFPGGNAPDPGGLTRTGPGGGPRCRPPFPGVPSAKVDLPQLPYLPLQVPQQLSLPADLPALASGVIPAAPIAPTPPAPGAPALPPGPPSLLAALP